LRNRARRIGFGLATVLGLKKRGFFIPYRYADQVPPPAARRPYSALEPIFAAAKPAILDLLRTMDTYDDAFTAIGHEPPPAPRWNQDWFPRLDAAAAYTLVRERRPSRIVEVGSGHSTRFLCRAVRDGQLSTSITSIDPAPRAAIDGLPATVIRKTIQEAGTAPFELLATGDMLFVDSSHILMPGTDVDLLLNRVLPILPSGVLVHFHDIFLPDGYPPEWDWRGYNEQLGIAALLQGNGFRIVWSSHYAATRMSAAVTESAVAKLEKLAAAREASLWLVKV
jgi:hypothetical protein